MKIWYATNSKTMPDNIQEIALDKIFIASHTKSSDGRCLVVRKQSSKLEGLSLGEPFLSSYLLLEEIYDTVQKFGHPDLLLVDLHSSYSYFTLIAKLALCPELKDMKIILVSNSNIHTQSASYSFPDYWVTQTSEFCKKAANGIISMHELSQVSLIHEKLWVTPNLTQYPVSKSIPPKRAGKAAQGETGLLSVIIPFYNLGDYIEETIKSLEDTNYRNLEVILVNDGSDDPSSIRVLEKIQQQFTSIKIVHSENKGLASARNLGAHHARGEYITFLDADDLVESGYYSQAIEILKRYDNISFVYSWVRYFGEKSEIWVTYNTEFPYLLASNMLAAFAVVRKSDFVSFGLNNPLMMEGMEDYESWISMCEAGCSGVSIPYPLVMYRIRKSSMSRQFTPRVVIEMYDSIVNLHPDLYRQFGAELARLINANGPGYIWNDPTKRVPALTYSSAETEMPFDINKYELLRILRSKKGSILVRWFLRLKLNKLF